MLYLPNHTNPHCCHCLPVQLSKPPLPLPSCSTVQIPTTTIMLYLPNHTNFALLPCSTVKIPIATTALLNHLSSHCHCPTEVQPDCCEHCTAHKPRVCCDLDQDNKIQQMVNIQNDVTPTTCRAPAKKKEKELDKPISVGALKLCDALDTWCQEKMCGYDTIYSPDLILHVNVLSIITLANENFLPPTGDLYNQTNWVFTDKYGHEIMILVHQFCPPLPSLVMFRGNPWIQEGLPLVPYP